MLGGIWYSFERLVDRGTKEGKAGCRMGGVGLGSRASSCGEGAENAREEGCRREFGGRVGGGLENYGGWNGKM